MTGDRVLMNVQTLTSQVWSNDAKAVVKIGEQFYDLIWIYGRYDEAGGIQLVFEAAKPEPVPMTRNEQILSEY